MTPFYLVYLTFIGEESKAKEFKYSLTLSGKQREVTWEGFPESIRNCDMKKACNGLVIPQQSAFYILGGDADAIHFPVSGKIWNA